MPRSLRRPDVLKQKSESTSFISTSTSTTQRVCLRRANLHFDNVQEVTSSSATSQFLYGAAVGPTSAAYRFSQVQAV